MFSVTPLVSDNGPERDNVRFLGQWRAGFTQAAAAERLRYRIVADLVMSSCPVPQAVGNLVIRASGSRPKGLVPCRNYGGRDRRSRHLSSLWEFRRVKLSCHLYGAQGQRQAYFLPLAMMNFMDPYLTTSNRVLQNSTDKFRSVIVGSIRMTNHKRTWNHKAHIVDKNRDNSTRLKNDEPEAGNGQANAVEWHVNVAETYTYANFPPLPLRVPESAHENVLFMYYGAPGHFSLSCITTSMLHILGGGLEALDLLVGQTSIPWIFSPGAS
ncbi:hypothetical protein TNCV_2145631 [Trichonephila clavipes]|uniref:Uncharacterized protein n=1 Tax=Trichonephila clavipes TaxID=2585209 RepID=A0A8X6SXN8_TRICX|nr:hypothetical protein TNCV_2145631 [Trichonephila clavipes]